MRRRSMMLKDCIHFFFSLFNLMLFIKILSSWVPEIQTKRWMEFISFYTEPYLSLFRRIIPPIGLIDISPIFAFMALQLLESILVGLLRGI